MAIEVPGDPLPTAEELEFAVIVQGVFQDRGMSLADPETADAYRATLAAFRLILEGAYGTGLLDEGQRTALTGTLAAAEDVPDII